MTSTGFENYAEALKIYLAKFREVSRSYLVFSTSMPSICLTFFLAIGFPEQCIDSQYSHNLNGGRISKINKDLAAHMVRPIVKQELEAPQIQRQPLAIRAKMRVSTTS